MTYYVIGRLRKWETAFEVRNEPGQPARIDVSPQMEEGSVGFLEVFDSREAADKAAEFYNGETQIFSVRLVEPVEATT